MMHDGLDVDPTFVPKCLEMDVDVYVYDGTGLYQYVLCFCSVLH